MRNKPKYSDKFKCNAGGEILIGVLAVLLFASLVKLACINAADEGKPVVDHVEHNSFHSLPKPKKLYAKAMKHGSIFDALGKPKLSRDEQARRYMLKRAAYYSAHPVKLSSKADAVTIFAMGK